MKGRNSMVDDLKKEYNKQLSRLNKGWDYCNEHPEEAEKYAEGLYNITKILSNIMNELIKYQILPGRDYITTEGFK
jgi:ABC-type nitrate/sulfonate/bicarbonate transport system substrate-binding protein